MCVCLLHAGVSWLQQRVFERDKAIDKTNNKNIGKTTQKG